MGYCDTCGEECDYCDDEEEEEAPTRKITMQCVTCGRQQLILNDILNYRCHSCDGHMTLILVEEL